MYRWTLFVLVVAMLGGCALPCSERDPHIRMLKALPADFFARLFAEVEGPSCGPGCKPETLLELREEFPRRFRVSRGRDGEASVGLKVCFDEELWLKFRGLGTERGEIYVVWGGIPPTNGEALLWQRTPR